MEIYKITNLINNKIYIGKDTTDDKDYYGSGVYIKKAILKYGKENFTKEVIDKCDNYEELSIKEKYWISFYKNNEVLYNLTDGGDGGDTWSNNPNIKTLKEKYYKPILIDDIEYPSIKNAAEKLNIERALLKHRLKSFNFKNYLYKDNDINIKNNKFIDKIESLRKKISIDGVIYNSISEACNKLNKRHDYILWRLQSKSYGNWFYLYNHDSNKEIETGPIKKKAVSVNDIIYESISNAVIGSGIDRQLIRYRLKSKNYPDYFYI
jgi:hypothetical protein